MKFASSPAAVFPLVIGVLFGVGSLSGVRAQGVYMYSIAANDGYGLEECLSGAAECGQVVADAWCEAHGHGSALSFGPASRYTGAPTQISTTPDSYVVNCSD
jgi:hypothetical protein